MQCENFYQVIENNNYDEVVRFIESFGREYCDENFPEAAMLSVDVTRNGQSPNALLALLENGFSFTTFRRVSKMGLPQCALTDILYFARCAKSRREEALKLLETVYKVELNRSVENCETCRSPEMDKLMRVIDVHLKPQAAKLKKIKPLEQFTIKLCLAALFCLL